MIETGGGTYDRADRHQYIFAALSGHGPTASTFSRYLLVALNEFTPDSGPRYLKELGARCKLMLDSGVFSLAASYARAHGVTHDEALKVPVEQMPGFEPLIRQYVDTVRAAEPSLWGYVEIDLGGRDQKRKTRARLHREGLRPIPVYHVLNDGPEYFDELASQYDRICVGNLVEASPEVRLRIMRSIWERRKPYPGLWIHFLGVTPSPMTAAYPPDSMDSSSWCGGLRWGAWGPAAMGKALGNLPAAFRYRHGEAGACERGLEAMAFETACETAFLHRYHAAFEEGGR